MSTWHEVKKEDIDIGEDGDINFYLFNDDMGSVYSCAKLEDVRQIIKQHDDHKKQTAKSQQNGD